MTRTARIVAVAMAATMLAGGCSLPHPDKAGADTIVLKLATIDGQVDSNGYLYGPRTFVRALPEVSGGRIQVEVTTTFGGENAAAESELVKAIARGDVDGGWPATRAFAAAGIPGLAAAEAPLKITSYAAEKDLANGRASRLVTASLEESGVKGLGLAVGPLRRPFGVKTFPVSTAAWHGMRFRSFNSPVQTASIEALGGRSVHAGTDWPALAQAGELDGIELDVAQYLANDLALESGKVAANVVLWPKMFVLSLNQHLWDGLDGQQRAWIQEAADRAVQASIDGEYPDDALAQQLCERGVRFKTADRGEILTARTAVRTVLKQLAAKPEEAPLLHEVLAVADRHPDPDQITVPEPCTAGIVPPDQSRIPTRLAPIPDGIYRKQIAEAEVAAAGLTNRDGTSGTWTLEVGDGHWYVSCRPIAAPGLDCGHALEDTVLDAGSFYGDERVVWMVSEPARLAEETGCRLPADGSGDHCHPATPAAHLSWSLSGDNLVFTSSGTPLSSVETILDPYVRIE